MTDLTELLNLEEFGSSKIQTYRNKYYKNKPYKLLQIENFLNDKITKTLENTLKNEIVYYPKNNDLYQFHQSYALDTLQNENIKIFRDVNIPISIF